MWLDIDTVIETPTVDAAYEMLARYRLAGARATVMLKNLSPAGATIDALPGLRHGDVLTLLLPSLRAKEAVVVWARGHTAGLEFDRPLHPDVFRALVRTHARRRAMDDALVPVIDLAAGGLRAAA